MSAAAKKEERKGETKITRNGSRKISVEKESDFSRTGAVRFPPHHLHGFLVFRAFPKWFDSSSLLLIIILFFLLRERKSANMSRGLLLVRWAGSSSGPPVKWLERGSEIELIGLERWVPHGVCELCGGPSDERSGSRIMCCYVFESNRFAPDGVV